MAYYDVYFNEKFIKQLDIPDDCFNLWCDSYTSRNGIMWYKTITENNNVYISDNMSDKEIKLVYNEQ